MRILLIFVAFALFWAGPSLAQTGFSVPSSICPEDSPSTMISFEIQHAGPVKLVVRDIFTNIHERTLLDSFLSVGTHQLLWDGNDDSGAALETGVYVFLLSGDGWETEQWSAIDCGADAAIQSRVIVGGHDVVMGLSGIVEDIGETELAIYSGDGAIRVKDFSYLNTSRIAFFSWAFEDSSGQILAPGDYIFRMTSASNSEDITFNIDPIDRGNLSVNITDGDGSIITGSTNGGEAPLVKGPLQMLEVDFGRPFSAAEIRYVLDGGLEFFGALEWGRPVSGQVRQDSTGLIFTEFEMSRPWKDIYGSGSLTSYGLFEPFYSLFRFGFDHQGYTRTNNFCQVSEPVDTEDWVSNPGPFYFTPGGAVSPPCGNPIAPGQSAVINFYTDEDGPVVMNIIDSSGNIVRSLVQGTFSAGENSVSWDRKDNSGSDVAEGLYHLIWETVSDDGGLVITSGDIFVGNSPTALQDGTIQKLTPTLENNHPNPFNPTTVISFDLPADVYAHISILSLDGRLVRTLLAASMSAGRHSVTWDGRDNQGRFLSSGTYFYQLRAAETVETRSMLLLK